MKGEMYISHPFYGAEEYIVIEELENVVALMRAEDQSITWVTKNTLKYKWTKKEVKNDNQEKHQA
jgi:hypothetical protein